MSEKTALVVKSNRLVEASYRLTLVEQQIVLYSLVAARETQKGLNPADPVTIRALDFAAQFGNEVGSVYGQLKEAMGTLFKRKVTIHDTDPLTGLPRATETRWISSASYIDGDGSIQIIFAPKAIPFITRLDKEFTSYRLDKVGKLSSVYAVRMYELLVQFLTVGKREFEITSLRGILGLEKRYSEIDDLKKFVLDTSVKQINEHTDITTSYTQRRTGRRVSHFMFTIASKDAAPKKKKASPRPTAPPATPRPKQTAEEKAHGTAKLAEMVALLKSKRP
jgi:plasmid replication initiation protein